jgi:hypothetical protein
MLGAKNIQIEKQESVVIMCTNILFRYMAQKMYNFEY